MMNPTSAPAAIEANSDTGIPGLHIDCGACLVTHGVIPLPTTPVPGAVFLVEGRVVLLGADGDLIVLEGLPEAAQGAADPVLALPDGATLSVDAILADAVTVDGIAELLAELETAAGAAAEAGGGRFRFDRLDVPALGDAQDRLGPLGNEDFDADFPARDRETAPESLSESPAGGAVAGGGSGGEAEGPTVNTIPLTPDGVWPAGWQAEHAGSPGVAGTGERVPLRGLNRYTDPVQGGDGEDRAVLGDGDDALILDDSHSAGPKDAPRVTGVETIAAGGGDDVVDFTSQRFGYGDVHMDGGAGDDVLWSSAGDDTLEGGAGADRLHGGAGRDLLTGGSGNDHLQGGDETGSRIEVVYEGTGAGYHNAVGYFVTDAAGDPVEGRILWADVKSTEAGESRAVDLPDHLPEEVGYFIIPDGARLNPTLADDTPVHFERDGSGRWTAHTDDGALSGRGAPAFFSEGAALNPDGAGHVRIGEDGRVGFEDLYGGGDQDYNDVSLTVRELDAPGDRLDGGAGDDVMIGGRGADLFVLSGPEDGVDRILDFDAAAGDRLDAASLLDGGEADSVLQLVEDGGSSVVQVNTAAAGEAPAWSDIAVLEGVTGVELEDILHPPESDAPA